MSIGMAMAALFVGTPLVATLRPVSEIALPGHVIRVADVAQLSGADSRIRLGVAERIVASLPAGRNVLSLSRAALAGLLRRTVPALNVIGSASGEVTRFRAPAVPEATRSGATCFAVSHPVGRGAPLTLRHVAPVACDAQGTRAPVLFDRRGSVVRAGVALPEGSYLGPIVLPTEPGVDRGDRLTMRSVVGPVRIERDVVALQAGRPGRRIFVRDEDGQTIVAPLSGSSEGRGQ